jgi:autotransporter-associated beta strand protein
MSSISGKIQVYANRIFNVTSRDLTINATVSGSYGLTKAGAGDLWLANSNSYTGLTVVQQGKVWVENPFALGATNSGTVVSNGASLVLDVNIGVTNEALTLNGPGGGAGFAALETEAGNCTWAGPITLNATSDLDAWQATAVLHLAGPISGPGGLELFGSGIHYFEGAAANTYSGVTTVDPGTTLLLKKTVSYGAIPAGLVVNGTARLLGNNELYYASPVTTADSSGM